MKDVLRKALDTTTSNPSANLVLIKLADLGDENGCIPITYLEIAKHCGFSIRSSINCINFLEKNGLVKVGRTYGGTGERNVYTLFPEKS